MQTIYVGEICALGAAASWALALVLFKKSGESYSPLVLNLFKNVIGLALLLMTLPFCGDVLNELFQSESQDVCLLLVSGILGITIADTLLLYSLRLIGVGLLTIMECTYTPSVVIVGWLFLGETIEPFHYWGAALIVLAVFVSSTHRPPDDRTRRELVFGMLIGALAIILMAVGIVVAKPVLESFSLILASTIRLGGGTLVLVVWMAASSKRATYFRVFRPSPGWRTAMPASILGTYVSMILWVGGFKFAPAAIAAVLNQTSTVIALSLATVVLKEVFTKRKFMACLMALAGVCIIAFSSERTTRPMEHGGDTAPVPVGAASR